MGLHVDLNVHAAPYCRAFCNSTFRLQTYVRCHVVVLSFDSDLTAEMGTQIRRTRRMLIVMRMIAIAAK